MSDSLDMFGQPAAATAPKRREPDENELLARRMRERDRELPPEVHHGCVKGCGYSTAPTTLPTSIDKCPHCGGPWGPWNPKKISNAK